MIITFNKFSNLLEYNGVAKKISARDALVLEGLIYNQGAIASREFLLRYAWGDTIVTDISLAKSISNLRAIINDFLPGKDVIVTVPRLGYRIDHSIFKMTNQNTPILKEGSDTVIQGIERGRYSSIRKTLSIAMTVFMIFSGVSNVVSSWHNDNDNDQSDFIYKTTLMNGNVLYSDAQLNDKSLLNEISCKCVIFFTENDISIYILESKKAMEFTFGESRITLEKIKKINKIILQGF
jgi:DNA-binding winged helix-turn-helix (wHTH) protein